MSKRFKRAVGVEETGYKYPLLQTVRSVMAVPRLNCGSASVRQCLTFSVAVSHLSGSTKDRIAKLAILVEALRIYGG